MIKSIVAAILAMLALSAGAEVFKCQGSNGKVQFSDTPCRGGSVSEIMPDRMPVTEQQRQEAQQRAIGMQSEAAALGENSAQRRGSGAERIPLAAQATSNADAYSDCVRDIERRGAPQNIKAELIAACRTVGTPQGGRETSAATIDECIRSVERTGATEAEKARQLVICRGGDVKPLFVPVPVQGFGAFRDG
jgi:hypothetical protein